MTFRHRVGINLHDAFFFYLAKTGRRRTMATEKRFLNAADVSEYMGISKPMAYKIIRQLNDELAALGYITISGKVSKKYFETKVYSGATA